MVAPDMRASSPRLPKGNRLSITSHPEAVETTVSVSDGRVLRLRPTRPEDQDALRKLFSELTHNEIRMRFLHAMYKVSDRQVEQFTRIGDDWEINLVLDGTGFSNERALCGFVQTIPDPGGERAEFAILVRSDLAGMGIGRVLMEHIIACARRRGIKEIYGESLIENTAMLKLASALGFRFVESGDPESVIMALRL